MNEMGDRPGPDDPGTGGAPTPPMHGIEVIDAVECWRLLQRSTVGRFAVEGPDGVPDVFPMNYVVHEGAIFVRSAPGGKLASVAKRPGIAFEIDGAGPTHFWSVVVRGVAYRLSTDAEIEAAGVLELTSFSPTPKHEFMRITPSSVTGRRFARRHRPTERPPAPAAGATPASGPVDKPEPIPHVPPL